MPWQVTLPTNVSLALQLAQSDLPPSSPEPQRIINPMLFSVPRKGRERNLQEPSAGSSLIAKSNKMGEQRERRVKPMLFLPQSRFAQSSSGNGNIQSVSLTTAQVSKVYRPGC